MSPASAVNLSGVDLSNRIGVAVARKTLDAAEAQGAAAVDMIRAAAEVGRRALEITPRPDLDRRAEAPISAIPGAREPGRVLDVTA